MKAIRCDLPYADRIEIHPMADLHIGDAHSNYKSIMERIEHIKHTENAYCILDGDLMDTAVALVDKLFVNTAASLDYGGYGDAQGYKPSCKRSPVIFLDGTKRDMVAQL